MNERIREIAREVGLLTHNPENRETKLDKFAELIVQECAEQVKNLRVNDYGISGAEIIREHFGVEE